MEKRKVKKKKRLKLKHLIFLLLMFFIVKTSVSQRIMIKSLNEKKLLEEQRAERLEASIAKLNFEIENKDSLDFLEKVAREDLKLVRPKEIIYIDKNKEENLFIRQKE